jgi:hypothetical protein
MGTLYTSQSAAGYNSSPPPDDGSQGANNQITWGTTIKAKLADPIKALADAINSQLTTALDLSPRAISTPDSAVASDHWRTLQVTGTTTITLSDAATMTSKYVVGIANLGVGTVTVTRATGANTVNGTAADFTLAPKQAVMLGVNQGATGYNILAHSLATGAGINTIQATTSVLTPILSSLTGASGAITLSANSFAAADLGCDLGGSGSRWAHVFTPIIDSGTTGSLSLKTNNGSEQFRVAHLGGTIANFYQVNGNVTTGSPQLLCAGSDTNIAAAISSKGNGSIQFYGSSFTHELLRLLDGAGANTLTITNGTNPTISTTAGNLAVGTVLDLGSTGQLQFPATQNPSAGVNVLDDYEEGTWTPSLGGSATYTIQSGNYTKIGNLVSFIGAITVNAIGTGSTTVISGLPFASLAVNFVFNARVVASSATAIVSSHGLNGGGVSTITIVSRTAANAADAVNAIFQNSTNVMVSGHYYTS